MDRILIRTAEHAAITNRRLCVSADQQFVFVAANDDIVASSPKNLGHAVPNRQVVGEIAPVADENAIAARAAFNPFGGVRGIDQIIAIAAQRNIAAQRAAFDGGEQNRIIGDVDGIIAAAAFDAINAIFAGEDVVVIAADQQIITVAASDIENLDAFDNRRANCAVEAGAVKVQRGVCGLGIKSECIDAAAAHGEPGGAKPIKRDAVSPHQHIIAFAAVDSIGKIANQLIIAAPAIQRVDPAAGINVIIAIGAIDRVVPAASIDGIVVCAQKRGQAGPVFGIGSAAYDFGFIAACDGIIAKAAQNLRDHRAAIAAIVDDDVIIACSAINQFGGVGGIDRIVARAAADAVIGDVAYFCLRIGRKIALNRRHKRKFAFGHHAIIFGIDRIAALAAINARSAFARLDVIIAAAA